MRRTPLNPIFGCFALSLLLYGFLLPTVSTIRGSSSTGGDVLEGIFEQLFFLAFVLPVYAVITLATAWWLYRSFLKTKPKRDSEARVLGFFTIVLMVPHLTMVLVAVISWIFSL